jgi:hypothetical protein
MNYAYVGSVAVMTGGKGVGRECTYCHQGTTSLLRLDKAVFPLQATEQLHLTHKVTQLLTQS